MVLEYIIEDSKYKDLIKDKIPPKGKNGIIKVNSKKFSGVNNYILTIEYKSSPVESAETLLNIFQNIKKIFDSNNVKYYILRNEASIELANRLYPLVCEFETKLRKFLYVALFDLDEAAQKITINKIKTVIQRFSKTEKIPQSNFLEELTLGEVFNLLFDNREFLDSAKNETKQIENTLSRKATKKELIAIIEKIEEKTLWNELFAPVFKNFSLPLAQKELFDIRNDVMHFHFISYEQYKYSLKLLRDLNRELDAQLAKGIVLENNDDNAVLVSNNYQYTFKALSALAESIQAISEQISFSTMSSISPVFGALNTIKQELTFPISEIAKGLYSTLSMLYELENSSNLSEESPTIEIPETTEKAETDDDSENDNNV